MYSILVVVSVVAALQSAQLVREPVVGNCAQLDQPAFPLAVRGAALPGISPPLSCFLWKSRCGVQLVFFVTSDALMAFSSWGSVFMLVTLLY